MRMYADNTPTPAEDKFWFQYDPSRPQNELVGFDKPDNRSFTLYPGDLIELTTIDITANQHREIMMDGTMIKVTAERLKKLKKDLNVIGAPAVEATIEDWAKLDDVELLNRCKTINSKGRLRRILGEIKKTKGRLYSTITDIEEMIEKATKR